MMKDGSFFVFGLIIGGLLMWLVMNSYYDYYRACEICEDCTKYEFSNVDNLINRVSETTLLNCTWAGGVCVETESVTAKGCNDSFVRTGSEVIDTGEVCNVYNDNLTCSNAVIKIGLTHCVNNLILPSVNYTNDLVNYVVSELNCSLPKINETK